MPDIDYVVREIKARIETVRAQRAGAEHEQQVASAAAEQALRQLKEEFGVGNPEEAMKLLQRLEADAKAECAKVEEQLAVAEAGE